MSGLTMTGGSVTGGGEIRFNSNLTVPINSSATGSTIGVGINLVSGSTTFNVANGAAATDLLITGGIYGSTSLVKSGAGFMKLTGSGSYAGTTNISAGTLQLAGGGLGGGNVTVASTATLAGAGSIGGSTTVNGLLVIGVDGATGTIGFSNNLTLASTSQTTMKLKKTGNTLSNDLLSGINTLTCGGTLTVTASGDALAAGDSFQLFSATTFSGTFSSVTLPALAGGLTWDTSRLYIDGSISLGKKPQTITFGALPGIDLGGLIPLNASASSGLPVSYGSSNPAVAIVQYGNDLTAIGTGTTTITASQPGSTAYLPATNVSQTLVVGISIPAVSTVTPILLNNSTASSGGSNIWDGGDTVTERGVCWSTSVDPTVSNNRTIDGSGTGSFTSSITGLSGSTTYYIRAYAKNSAGYGYGGTATIVMPPAAITGIWTNLTGGSWPTTGNWQSGGVPNGIGSTANFSTLNITATRTVTLDSALTLSGMTFGDTNSTHGWNLNAGTSGSLTLDTYSGAPTVTVTNQTTTLGVALAGNKGLIKAGAGTLSLGATATLTGGITVNAGNLQLKPADYNNSLPTSSQVTVNSGGTLTVAAINSIGNSIGFLVNSGGILNFTPYHCHLMGITLNGGTLSGTGSGKYNSEDFALDGDINVTGSSPSAITIANGIGIGNRTVTVADVTGSPTADLALSGAGALRGTGVLTKAGLGTMTISNANVHTGGVMVSNGTLLANNTTGSATGTGAVSVSAPATLGGNGSVGGALTVNGSLAPGNNSVGTLTAASAVTLSPSSSIAWQISDWTGTSGTGFDKLSAASLVLNATAVNPVTIRISALAIANFTETSRTFLLAQTTGGITGFDPAEFVIDATGIPTAKGTWAVQQSGNDLVLAYTRGNTAPAFQSNPISISATQGTAVTGNLVASDPENDSLTFTKLTGPSWLVVSSAGALSGTPGNSEVSLNSFSVQVTDSLGASSTAILNVTVANVNDAPTFNSGTINGAGATQGQAYSGSVSGTANDIDSGDTLTYSKIVGPTWLSVAPNGALTGTPGNANVGSNSFTLRVTDAAGLFAQATLNISVANVNDAPTFPVNPVMISATEDSAFTGQLAASDVDAGDTLTYTKLTGPAWLIVSTTGALGGTPANADVGPATATVEVKDAANATASVTLNITVANVNDAPTFAINPVVLSATEDSAFTGQLAASDVDAGDTLTYTKLTGPAWLTISTTGALGGMPANGDVGPATATVEVNDAANATATVTLSITVTNENDVPTFAIDPVVLNAIEDSVFTGQVTASDIDAGDTLTYTKLTGPAWLTVSSNGALGGTPTNGDAGLATATVEAKDASNSTASVTLSITVTNENDVPTFAVDPVVLSATEDSAFTGQVTATDIDAGDTLTYTKLTGPAWLTVSTSGALGGTPANGDVGAATASVEVKDAANATASVTLSITVANVNDAPTFTTALSAADASQGQAYSGSIAGTASDVDTGDTLTYSKASGPSWLNVAADGAISGTPTSAGINSFTIRITDAAGLFAEAPLSIQVIASNPDANGNGILDTWETQQFGNAASGNNAANDDADHDGLSNLLEFALGTNPTVSGANPILHDRELVGADRHLRLTIPKNPAATNLSYIVEVCENLAAASWSAIPTVIESETATQLIVRDSTPMSASSHRFIRLRVHPLP
jgi:autotransporter-associated beta strand protein